MGTLSRLSSGMFLRLLVPMVVVLVSGLGADGYRILPWALLVVTMELVTAFLLQDAQVIVRRRLLYAAAPTVVGALCAGLAIAVGPSALPLAVIPIYRAAERWGRRGAAITAAVWLASAALVLLLVPHSPAVDPGLAGRWAAIALLIALGAWWTHRTSTRFAGPLNPIADEAALLLTRLGRLTSDLEGGFDPATSAEMLLDALGRPGPLSRSAVLVGSTEDRPVPLALRGADRVPWPDPTMDRGVIGQAWRWGRTGSTWDPEMRRELRAVPLVASGGEQIGILIQDIMTDAPSDEADLGDLRTVAQRFGPLIGVALAFTHLRERAGFEERERLAREMHDGIAQELVALGFHLDLITRTAGKTDHPSEQTVAQLEAARTQLRRILGDLRSHISDLRVSVRPERGLGATMTSRLQSFGTSTEVVVSLRLDESGFRLPARAETALYQLFLEGLADVKSGGATGVDVDLTVIAPHATLRMRHDGRSGLSPELFAGHPLVLAGGHITIDTADGLDLVARLSTTQTSPAPVHVNEKVPLPS